MEIPTYKPLPITHEQFLRWQVAQYNLTVRPDNSGYNCSACKNRRYFAMINEAGDFALRPCTCNNLIAQKLKEAEEEKKQKGKKKNV